MAGSLGAGIACAILMGITPCVAANSDWLRGLVSGFAAIERLGFALSFLNQALISSKRLFHAWTGSYSIAEYAGSVKLSR